jgi:predicted AAA+ superfamily ATPase
MVIERAGYKQRIDDALRVSPVVALLGPRQCGKTTLARQVAATKPGATYLDLEDPRDAARLAEPMLVLERLRGLVVLDEVQRRPDLFPVLRVLADRAGDPARFLVLGSASPGVVAGVSESLAGRVRFVDLGGFALHEVGGDSERSLWLRGGLPRSYLAATDDVSLAWRLDFIRTFLVRDLRLLGLEVSELLMRRFWTMLAHYHGQTWNASALATSLGISYKTTQHYLDILTGAFLVRQLLPWTENVGKRLRRAPKVYLADSGLLHALLGLGALDELEAHPKLGASWEGFALEQVLRAGGWHDAEVYYWATHGGAELDLLVLRHGRRYGFEFKWADGPRPTRSMRVALTDCQLARLYIVHPGAGSWPVDDAIEVVALRDVPRLLADLDARA